MLPMINTAAEAKAAVNYCKFPPVGIRGQGSPFAPWMHSLSIPDYIQQANKSLLTIAQIETKEGLANAEEIAAVEGVGEYFRLFLLVTTPGAIRPHPRQSQGRQGEDTSDCLS